MDWSLHCSQCEYTAAPEGLPTVCPTCGSPLLVKYDRKIVASERGGFASQGHSMWRYRRFLPLHGDEVPVSLGEGGTPMLRARRLGGELGMDNLWIKDEAPNPTGSFKARGLSGKVKLITFDFSDAHVEALEDGTIDKMIVQDPYRIGYEAVRSLADHLAGRKSVKRLDLPARVVGKADLAKPEIRALVSPAWMKK